MRIRGRGRGVRRQVGWYCDHTKENEPWTPEGWRKNTHKRKVWKRGKWVLAGATQGMQTQQAFHYMRSEPDCPAAVPVYVIDYPKDKK